MYPWLRIALRWSPLLLWTGAIAGAWLMPVRVVVVLTGAAVTATCASVLGADDKTAGQIVTQLASLTRPDPGEPENHLRQAKLRCPPVVL
jgi:hypothetical protein